MERDDHGNYYSMLTYASWAGWKARAEMEKSDD
jgi:hypothetical protein